MYIKQNVLAVSKTPSFLFFFGFYDTNNTANLKFQSLKFYRVLYTSDIYVSFFLMSDNDH